MAFIKWNDSCSVHVGEIDGQHQKLIGLLNDLHDAMTRGQGKDVVDSIINGLVDYTKTHFATEEKYFALYKYPGAPAHIQEHSVFVDRVVEFKRETDNGQKGLSIEVMLFLKDWLLTHIKGSDMKYSAFFNQHGLC
ncbi:MAG: bacteriohemerythrin [Desulfocucumaceae bacterium]